MEFMTQGLVSMIYHKKHFATLSTTHAPPNASLEQHRHLSALIPTCRPINHYGILAFRHFVRIILEAALLKKHLCLKNVTTSM
jgi:hypothetical protein